MIGLTIAALLLVSVVAARALVHAFVNGRVPGVRTLARRPVFRLFCLAMAGGPTRDTSDGQFQTENNHLRARVGDYKVGSSNSGVRSARFVKRDSDDHTVIATTAGDTPLGYLETGQVDNSTPSTFGPGEWQTGSDFAEDDLVNVSRGPGYCVPVVVEDSSGTVNAGDPLTTGASGKLKGQSALSVAVPSGTTTVQSTAAQPDLTESGGTLPEPLVAYASETGDPSGGDVEIMAYLAI